MECVSYLSLVPLHTCYGTVLLLFMHVCNHLELVNECFLGAVIAILREHKADYGLQRIYATIGGMISSPLSGWLIDYASANKDFTDFR